MPIEDYLAEDLRVAEKQFRRINAQIRLVIIASLVILIGLLFVSWISYIATTVLLTLFIILLLWLYVLFHVRYRKDGCVAGLKYEIKTRDKAEVGK